jgi:hypothetical protein
MSSAPASDRKVYRYLERPATNFLATQTPEWFEVTDEAIEFIHHFDLILLGKLPPPVEALWGITFIASLVLSHSF